jgi:hypothetical protein
LNLNEKIVSIFNKKLMDFIKEIIEIYPNNKDFKSMRTQIRMVISSSENLPITNFKKHVTHKYKDNIISKDEDFFLNLDLTGTPFVSFNYLKDLWKNMSENTKNAMWKHIELLTKLSEKYKLN